MLYQVNFKIADTVFQVNSLKKEPVFWLKDNYSDFLSKQNPDLKIFLNFNRKYNNSKEAALFKSGWRNGSFQARTKFFSLDLDFAKRKALVSAGYKLGIADLIRFICYIMYIKKGSLLLHAGAVIDKGLSYVFFGRSESGKTTIAKLSEGKIVLNDETVAITKNNGSYFAHATPFFGKLGRIDKNTSRPIKTILFINKYNRFGHCKLKPKEAVKRLLCSSLVNIPDLEITNCLLNALGGLTQNLPCYELRFKPDRKIWSYIHGFIK